MSVFTEPMAPEEHDIVSARAVIKQLRSGLAASNARVAELEAANSGVWATANACRHAVRMAAEQLEFLHGDRTRAWEGDFLARILKAAIAGRDGCGTCGGSGQISGGSGEAHIPGAPEPCPHCDHDAPGFAPAGGDK